MSTKRPAGLKRHNELAALEPRMLFDGAALVSWDAGTAREALPDTPPAPPAAAAAPVELVFISPEVANPAAIIEAFGPAAHVIVLDGARDGIDQISEALAGRSGVSAIHLVSHGAAGFISLPGQSLSGATLEARAQQLAGWSNALSAEADILVYGCDVAADGSGQALLGRLATLTGADVAASINDTGAGDWTLEYTSGAVATSAVFTEGRGDAASYADRLATIDLSGSTGWTTIMVGAGKDPYGDSQAGAADTDIIGDATHGSLYTAYDDKGTASVADDTLVFRMRIDNPTSTTNFGGVAIVGMDANLDGKIDLFFSVDGRNNGQAVRLLDPGTGANLSPSTTSTSALPTGWLPNNGVYGFTPSTYAVVPVSAATDSNWGPSTLGGTATDLTGRGGADAFVSWRVPITDIALVLAKPSPTDRNGTGPRGTTGIAGYGKDTVVQYISFTQTQTGPINGDLNGVGPNYDKNATFASLGTFTSPMSASNPVPDGLSVTIAEPVGDGLLAGGAGATEASNVTLTGSTKATVGSTVNLTITDSASGSVSTSATVVAGLNGMNTWSVGGVNLSGLADGTLGISASVVNNGVTATDTAAVVLDKTGPLIGITQLATTTAGKPVLSGTTDLPDGSRITLTLDPDNNAGTANLVYQVIASGGVWTLNTATATPLSGSMPSAGLTATTRITATGSDAAGNVSTATALNRPTVTSLSTNTTLPVIGGSWTSIAGDTLVVNVYTNNAGAPGTLLASYSPAISGDSWSIDLASAVKSGGGTLAALTPGGVYQIVASAVRGGASVADTTSGELTILAGAAIDIIDSDGSDDDVVTSNVARPTFSGTSTVANGYITLSIVPAGNGPVIRYSVATDASGNWSLNTANASAQPVYGSMPAAGLSGTATITAATAPDANGQFATDSQSLTTAVASIQIGTSASDFSGVQTTVTNGGTVANIIVGDGILNKAEDDAVIVFGTTTNIAPGGTVTITVSDGTDSVTRTTTVAANGSFTLSGNAMDLSALRSTSLEVTAAAGGVSSSKVVTHDAIAPQIVLTTPSRVKASAPIVYGNVALPEGSIVQVWTGYDATRVNATVSSTGDFSASVSSTNAGTYRVYAESVATDVAGNKVVQVFQDVVYQAPNTTPPSISIGSITGTSATDTTITKSEISSGIVIQGTLAGTATISSGTVVVTISDGTTTVTSGQTGATLVRTDASWTLTLTDAVVAGFRNGTLIVTAQLTDTVGNGGGTLFVVKDVAQPSLLVVSGTPTVAITAPIDSNGVINAVEDNAVIIQGYAVNATGGEVKVTVSDADNVTANVVGYATVGTDGSWSTAGMNLEGLADGTLTVTALVDPDRNPDTNPSASTSATVLHDKTGPLLHITSAATVGNPNPFISGTSQYLTAGSEVMVTVNSDRTGGVEGTYTATVQSDGSWRVATAVSTPINSIITATASDGAGNTTQISATAIAALSSDTGTSASDFITNTRALSFSGYANAGDLVTVRLNGTVIGTAVQAGVDGSWTVSHTGVQLANGSYTLTASVANALSTATSTQIIVIDSQAVAITAITQDAGASAGDYITSDNALIISGTATADAQVTAWATDSNGVEVFRQVASAGNGSWSIDRSASALADGTYIMRAAVTDASGVTNTVSQALVIDTSAQIGITTNYRSADSTPVLSGTTDLETGRALTVSVAVAGGTTYSYTTTVAANGTWSVDTGAVAPAGQGAPVTYANGAALTITASGSDVAGNAASASKAMLIDLAAPVIGITTALDYTGSNTPDGTLTAAEDTNVVLRGTTANVPDGGVISLTITDGTLTYADTATVSNNTWQVAALNLRSLANGTITVVATYLDDSGTAFSAAATVIHDKSVAGTSVTIDSISTDTAVSTDFNTSDNTLVFRGGAAAGATVAVRLANGGTTVFSGTVTADAGGNWSYDYRGSTLADATYTLSAQVGAGTAATQLIVVDTAGPSGAVTVNNPVVTTDTTPQLTGTAVVGAGETLTVSVNGKTYTAGDGLLSLSGNAWTLDIPVADALEAGGPNAGFQGVYQVVATITDIAGNTATDNSTGELTVQDATAPVIDLAPSDGLTRDRSVTSTQGATVSLDDDGDAVTVVEAGDLLPYLTLDVAGILDGAAEKLVFGSTVVAADGSDAVSLNLSDVMVGGVRVAISFSAGTFTIERHDFAPLTAAQAQAVMRDIQYRNDSGATSTAGVRSFGFGATDALSNAASVATTSVAVTNAVAGPAQVVTITSVTDDQTPVTGTVADGGVTNDVTPELAGALSGALDVNEVVGVYRDGVRVGTALVSGTSWTFTDNGLQDGGSYSYSAKVENTPTQLEGAASASYAISIDTSAPSQAVGIVAMTSDSGTAGDFITADGSAGRTVSGTVDALGAGETLEISADGGVTWGAASVTGTAWTFTDSGAHSASWTIVSRIVDAAGNVGGAASQLVVYQAAPQQTVAIDSVADDVAPVTGMVADGGVTNDTAPELSGSLSAALGTNEVLAVYRDGTRVGEASVSGMAWTYADSGLSGGAAYSYSAVVENTLTAASGAQSAAHVINVDTSAATQTVSISAMTGDSGTAGDFVTSDGSAGRTVSGSLSAALAVDEILEISMDGGSTWIAASVNGVNWTAVDAGAHAADWTIASRIIDAAGNVGGAASQLVVFEAGPQQTVAIDTVADDVAPITGTVSDGGVTNDDAPELAGTLSAALGSNEVVAVYRDGVRVGAASVSGTTWTYLDSGLADGASYAYTAVVENTVTAAAGSLSATYTVNVDTSAAAHTVYISSMTNDSGTANDFITSDGSAGRTVTGSLSASLGADEVLEISMDGGSTWAAANVNGFNWTAVDSGAHSANWSIVSRIVDAAGNEGGAASQLVVLEGAPQQTVSISAINDDVAPVTGTVADGGHTNDTAPGISGTISAPLAGGEVLAVYRDGVRVGEANVSGTSWDFADSGLVDGNSYSYTAQVENPVNGTASVASSAFSISVDTSAPAQAVVIVAMTQDSGTAGDFITADGAAGRTVSGTLSAALATSENLEVSVDGGSTWTTASVSGTGWGVVDSGAHAGDWTISTRIVDAAGNTGGAASQAVVLLAAPQQTVAIDSVTDDVSPQAGAVSNGGVTNDIAPELAGSLSAALGVNEVVAVYRDGARIGVAAVSGTAWTYLDSGLVDGTSYSYAAVVENTLTAAAGTQSSAHVIAVDTSAPGQAVTIDAMTRDSGTVGDFVTADGGAGRTVSGSLSAALGAGESLEISMDGGVTWGAASVSGTNWRAVDSASHTAGWTIQSRIVDAAGNAGGAAAQAVVFQAAPQQTVTIDTVTDDVAPRTGVVANGGCTNDVAPDLAGTLSATLGANEIVAVYRDGTRIGTATVSGTSWTYSDGGLADGAGYSYAAVVENTVTAASGTSSTAHVINIDTSAPGQTVSITGMTRDSGVAGDFVTADGGAGRTVSGTLSAALGAGESLEISMDGGVTWGAASVSGTGWSAVDSGSHAANWSIQSRIIDAAGNTGGAAARAVVFKAAPQQTVTIDSVSDDVSPRTGAVANGGVTNDAAPALAGSLSATIGATEVVAIYRDGTRIGTATVTGTSWTYTDSSLADGASYSYAAVVENTLTAATGTQSAAHAIVIDTSAPSQTVAITGMTRDSGVAGDFVTADGGAGRTVSGTLSAALGAGESLEISMDGGVKWNAASVSGTAWNAMDSASHAANWSIQSRIVDAAGNVGGSATQAVVFQAAPQQSVSIDSVTDDVAPQAGVVANGGFTNDIAPELTGSLSATLGANEVVAVYRDGVRIGTASVSGTAWTFADSALVDGNSYTYAAVVENTVTAASGTQSSTHVISVDTGAPGQTVTITGMTRDSGVAGDFVTADGGAGRTVSGALSSGLASGETLEVSMDGGVTWAAAAVSGTGWSAVDSGAHAASWTIATRIVDAAGNVGGNANQIAVFQAAPQQAVAIDSVTDDVAPRTGAIINGGVTNDAAPVLAGSLSFALGANEIVAVYRDGVRIGVAAVVATSWTYDDSALSDGASYAYSAVVENTATGAFGSHSAAHAIIVDTSAPGQVVTITGMTADSGVAGDFVTADGSAGRTVTGTLSAALAAGEALEISMDNGTTWSAATVSGTSWSAVDSGAHAASWTIRSRIVDAAGNVGGNASQAAVFQAAPQQIVAIDSVTDDVSSVTGVVSNGGVTNDVAPALAGSLSAVLGSNEVVAVYRDGVRIGTATVSATSWTYADAALVDGASYSYTAVVENTVTAAAGSQSAAHVITVDTSAPSQSVSIAGMTRDSGVTGDFITADGAAGRTVTGSLSAPLGAGEALEISMDGGTTWAAAAVSGVSWSAVDNGAHLANWTIVSRIVDAAGNAGGAASQLVQLEGAPQQAVLITGVADDVSPRIGNVASGAHTNDTAPDISGTVSAPLSTGEVLAVYRDGVRIGEAAVSGTTWTFADHALSDGASYSYTAQVENTVNGTASVSSAAYGIVIDASTPVQTVTITGMTRDTGSAGDFITADGAAGRTVTGELSAVLGAGEVLEVSMDGVSWTAASVNGVEWSAIDSGAHTGNWTIATRIVDAAGNVGGAASQAVVFQAAPQQIVFIDSLNDDVAPLIGVVSNGGVTNDTAPAIEGSLSAALGSNEVVAVYRDGVRIGSATVNGTAWSFSDGALADGASYAYTAVVENTVTAAMGVQSGAYLIDIDTSAPTQLVTITSMTRDSGLAGDFVTADGAAGRTVTGSLSASLAAGERLEISMDGGASWGAASVVGTSWSAVDHGAHATNWTIASRIVDAAGNTGGSATQIAVFQAAPQQTVTIDSVTDDVAPRTGHIGNGGVTNDSAPQLAGSVSAALGANEVVAVYRDGVRIGEAAVSGAAWTYSDSALADGGSYSYRAVVENLATAATGSMSGAHTITVDTSAPGQVVSITAMTRDSGVIGDFLTADGGAGRVVSGGLSAPIGAGEVLEISMDGGTTWTGASINGTSWSAVDGAAHASNWTIVSRIVDAAGNVGGLTSRGVLLEGAPQQTVTIDSVQDDVAPRTGNVVNGGFTNDVSPVITGSVSAALAAGDVLAVYRDGVRVGEAVVSGTGWSYADDTLADGASYSYTAIVENPVTATSSLASAAYGITVDTSAPAQIVTFGAMTRDTGIDGDFITADGGAGRTVSGSLSGALDAGEVLEISMDGGVTWVAASVSGTTWSAIDSAAHAVSWTIVSRIVDAAGNAGGVAVREALFQALPQQTASIDAVIDDVSPRTGIVASGGVTNDGAPEVAGSISEPLSANEVLAVYRDGVRIGEAAVSGTAWSFADAGLRGGGQYAYAARVENTLTAASGGLSSAYLVDVDTSAPAQVVTVVAMTRDTGAAGDFITADGAAGRTISGTLSAPLVAGESLEISVDGGLTWTTPVVNGTGWTVADGSSHGASWVISSRITDAAGNAGPVAARPVTLTAAPAQAVITAVQDDVAALTGTIASGGVTNDTAPLIVGTVPAVLGASEQVAIYRNGERIGVASVTGTGWTYQDSGLASGSTADYTVKIENTVSASAGAKSAAYSVRVDSTAPGQIVTVDSMTRDTEQAGDFVTSDGGAGRIISGTLSAPLASGEVLEVSFDGGATWSVASVSGATWQTSDAAAHSANWTIATRIVDAAGNQGGAFTRAVTLTAPVLVITPDPVPTAPPADPVSPPPAVVVVEAPAPVVVPVFGTPVDTAARPADAPVESSSLAPGQPLVSTGIPAPDFQSAALFMQTAQAPALMFEIDTGNTALGALNAVQTLSGTDVGAGFTINVRQTEGGGSAKESLKLVSAVVRIEAGLDPDSDQLQLSTSSPNITASYDAATGTLTLSGAASAAEYEKVIQGVKLRGADGGDVKDKRTLRFTIKAESGQTQSGTKEYRGPGNVPNAANDAVKPGKPGFMAQIAKAAARQTEGRDQFASLANRKS